MLQRLRGVISGESYAIIKEAIDNTNDAHRDAMKAPSNETLERVRIMSHRQAQVWYKHGAPYVKKQCRHVQ